MLQKSKSQQINLFKYSLLIPMVLGMLIYSSCEKEDDIPVIIEEQSLESLISELKFKIEEKESVTEAESKALLKLMMAYKYKDNSENIHDFKVVERDFEEVFEEGEEIEVSFAVIDKVPVFPGCESLTTNEAKKDCMSKSIANYVSSNFNTKLAEDLGLKGRQRISAIFKIDTEGNVIGVRSRAPHPYLEAEATRVINTLPKMISGEQKGKKVTVPYSLPIIFQVADEKAND